MKKIYVTLFAGLFFSQVANAQLTLTKAFNEPVAGNIEAKKGYDSLSATVPKNTGANQVWNFTNFTANSTSISSTYTTPAAVPASSAFTGATLVEDQGGGSYNFWKASSTPTYELLGSASSTLTFNYSGSSAIAAIWPVAFGYNNTDLFSGNLGGSLSGTFSGTINTNAIGNGTLITPGGTSFTNILQIKTTNVATVSVTFPPTTLTVTGIDYTYYHSSQKFPLMTVNYQNSGTGYTGKVWLNNALITGINDKNLDATFAIYPNPAKDAFNLTITNSNNANGKVVIFNAIGQVVKTVDLGNGSSLEKDISISDLSSGIYIVKTSLGERSSSRRLIVE